MTGAFRNHSQVKSASLLQVLVSACFPYETDNSVAVRKLHEQVINPPSLQPRLHDCFSNETDIHDAEFGAGTGGFFTSCADQNSTLFNSDSPAMIAQFPCYFILRSINCQLPPDLSTTHSNDPLIFAPKLFCASTLPVTAYGPVPIPWASKSL